MNTVDYIARLFDVEFQFSTSNNLVNVTLERGYHSIS